MNRDQAELIARVVKMALASEARHRLKSIDVCPKLHEGMLTIRVYMVNKTAEEPEAHIFKAEEI